MELKKLNNGVEIPILGFGTFMLSGTECKDAVANAINVGYRLIDTAEAYGNEQAVGNGIKKSRIDRKELFLVTKVNYKSYEDAMTAINQSLSNLQTDYIDLLLLHWPFANYYSAWRALEKAYADGKIRAIGISNFEPNQVVDLIAYNKVVPTINQIETNLYCQRTTERTWLDKKSVAHMSYAPLGQGNRNEMYAEPVVNELATKYGKTEAQILLRFLTQKDIVVIPRSKSLAHIKENIDIFDFTLTDDEMNKLIDLNKNTAMIGNPQTPELNEMSLTW